VSPPMVNNITKTPQIFTSVTAHDACQSHVPHQCLWTAVTKERPEAWPSSPPRRTDSTEVQPSQSMPPCPNMVDPEPAALVVPVQGGQPHKWVSRTNCRPASPMQLKSAPAIQGVSQDDADGDLALMLATLLAECQAQVQRLSFCHSHCVTRVVSLSLVAMRWLGSCCRATVEHHPWGASPLSLVPWRLFRVRGGAIHAVTLTAAGPSATSPQANVGGQRVDSRTQVSHVNI
jgi:hypothetical protein